MRAHTSPETHADATAGQSCAAVHQHPYTWSLQGPVQCTVVYCTTQLCIAVPCFLLLAPPVTACNRHESERDDHAGITRCSTTAEVRPINTTVGHPAGRDMSPQILERSKHGRAGADEAQGD